MREKKTRQKENLHFLPLSCHFPPRYARCPWTHTLLEGRPNWAALHWPSTPLSTVPTASLPRSQACNPQPTYWAATLNCHTLRHTFPSPNSRNYSFNCLGSDCQKEDEHYTHCQKCILKSYLKLNSNIICKLKSKPWGRKPHFPAYNWETWCTLVSQFFWAEKRRKKKKKKNSFFPQQLSLLPIPALAGSPVWLAQVRI